jgi:hypothetical protein
MKAEQTITHLRKKIRLDTHVQYLKVNIGSKNLGREAEIAVE